MYGIIFNGEFKHNKQVKMRQKRSSVIKTFSLIAIFACQTSKLCSINASIQLDSNSTNSDCSDCFKNQPKYEPIQEASNHKPENVTYSLDPPKDLPRSMSTSEQVGPDKVSKSVYSSLVKILYHMKQQIDKNKASEREDSSLFRERDAPETASHSGISDGYSIKDSPDDGGGHLIPISKPIMGYNRKGPSGQDKTSLSIPGGHTSVGETSKSPVEQAATSDVSSEPQVNDEDLNNFPDSKIYSEDVQLKKYQSPNQMPIGQSQRRRQSFKIKHPSSYKQSQLLRVYPTKFDNVPTQMPWGPMHSLASDSGTERPLFTISSSIDSPISDQKRYILSSDYSTESTGSFDFIERPTSGPGMQVKTRYEDSIETRPLTRTKWRKNQPIDPEKHLSKPSAQNPSILHPLENQNWKDQLKSSVQTGPISGDHNSDYHDDEMGRATKLSTLLSEAQDSPGYLKSRHGNSDVHLQQIHLPPVEAQNNYQIQSIPISQPHQPKFQPQHAVFTLASAPGGLKGYFNSRSTSASGSSGLQQESNPSYSFNRQQPDLLNQPQTIQITAVPNVGLNGPIIRYGNGLGMNNIYGNGVGFGFGNGGFMDTLGRQVVMVSADRRQIDWSLWIWPLLAVVTLPLVLGAIFVPVFLKTIVILIQILQSLGLLLPITTALSQQLVLASGSVGSPQNETMKS